jgi:hypothetical protein
MSASTEFPLEVRPVAAVNNKEQVDQIVKGDHDVLLMYGAAPKVEMRLGQVVTNIVPDFASRKWVGFAGKIAANPFLDICRSQIDVQFDCSAETLLREMKGFD